MTQSGDHRPDYYYYYYSRILRSMSNSSLACSEFFNVDTRKLQINVQDSKGLHVHGRKTLQDCQIGSVKEIFVTRINLVKINVG